MYNLTSTFGVVFTDKEENFMYGIDHDYDLAIEGQFLGTLEDVEHELITFTSVYKEYTFDNYSYWVELDKMIDDRLDEVSKIENERIKELQAIYDKKNKM